MNFRDVPIGSAFDVQNGATPASGEPSYWDGDTPWVSPADLGKLNTRFIENGERSITQDGYASCGTQMVPAGSIILSIRAPIGHIAIASNSMCFNQGCRGLVPRSMIRSDFSYWALVACRPKLEAAGQGTTFIELSRDKLRSERIPIPVHETQKAIADFLDRETARIDQLIEKKQRILEVLGGRARSVNEHFFLEAEPISIQPLHRLYRVVTGKTPSRNEEDNFSDEEGFLWATPANLGFLAPIETTKEFLTAKGFEGQPIVDPGTVLLNGIGASVGKIGIAGACLSFNQQIHALNPKKRVLDDRFLFFQLLTLKEQLVLLANSTTLPILNSERLGRLELRIFDSRDQKRHCANMNAILQNEETTSRKIAASMDRLREFRSALITVAVTGQIDVSTWGKHGATGHRLDQIKEATNT